MTYIEKTKAVYVNTYARYNKAQFGEWVLLDEFENRDEFYEHCKALYSNEPDPELLFEDWAGFPARYFDESEINAAVWEWMRLPEEERFLVCALLAHGFKASDRESCYLIASNINEHEIQRTIGEEWLESNTTDRDGPITETLKMYFDAEAFGRDAIINSTYVLTDDAKLYQVCC